MVDERLLDTLYGAAVDGVALERALLDIAGHFDCRSAALVLVDSQVPSTNVALGVGLFGEDAQRRYMDEFAALDPAPAAFARLPAGVASSTERLFDAEMRTRSVFLNEFYWPLGLGDCLGGQLFSDRARISLIGVQREIDRAPFESSEIAKLQALLPHIARALQLRRAFARLEGKFAALEAALDRLEAGVLLLDATGAALACNRALRAVATRGDGFALDRAGRPVLARAEARQRLDRLIGEAARGGVGGIMTAARATSPRPYGILVARLPEPLAASFGDPAPGAGTIVIVHDPDSRPMGAQSALQAGLGLTPSAAKLVAALAGDDDLQSFAEREGITIHTSRFHLRSALARTGAKTQAELVRLALRLLRDLALRGSASR